jgi:chromosome segregation ATPase
VLNTLSDTSEEKSKKIISHYATVIGKIREELSQQRQLLQKYRCKTHSQKNTIVSLRKRVKATKQEKTGNDKFKAKIEDKGVQCNTMRSLIKDLKDDIEALQLEIVFP